jgi:hypothetical protein
MAATNTTTEVPVPPHYPGPTGNEWLALGYAALVVVAMLIPYTIDLVLSYSARKRFDDLRKSLAERGQFKELGKVDGDPTATKGLARVTMTIGIIALVGVALGHILVRGLGATEGMTVQLVTTIVSSLLGSAATIIGFYFGQGGTSPKPGEGKDTAKDPPKDPPK